MLLLRPLYMLLLQDIKNILYYKKYITLILINTSYIDCSTLIMN